MAVFGLARLGGWVPIKRADSAGRDASTAGVIFCSDSTVDGQFDGKAVDRC